MQQLQDEPRRKPTPLHLLRVAVVTAVATVIGIFILWIFIPPVPRSVVERARRVRCLTNLKQVVLALKQYAGDYGESYPDETIADGRIYWRSLGRLHPTYASSVSIFFCPSSGDKPWTSEEMEGWKQGPIPDAGPTRGVISYSLAMDGSDPNVLRPLRLSAPTVRVAADKPCAVAAAGSGPNRGNHGNAGRNVGFLDGSGRWVKGADPLEAGDGDPRGRTGERWWSDPPIR